MKFLLLLLCSFCLLHFVISDASNSLEMLGIDAIKDGDVTYVWNMNNCDNNLGKRRPIHNSTIWASLQETYKEVIGVSNSMAWNESPDGHINSGFEIEYSVNYSKNNKRGIFAREKIKKGQVIYQIRARGDFPDPLSFIDFLNLIPTDLICDAIEWGHSLEDKWYYDAYQNETNWLSISFDDISYCNWEGDKNIDYNLDDNNLVIMAVRDIDVGEELICSNDWKKDWEWFFFLDEYALVLRELNDCERIKKTKRPIFGKSLWILMQKIYEELSNSTVSNPVDVGFKVKYSIDYSKTRGRSIFAREEIYKGQLVYEHKRDAYLTRDIYDEFLDILTSPEQIWKPNYPENEKPQQLEFLHFIPPALVCDLDMWVYEDDLRNYWIFDLDDMVYCNTAAEGEENIIYDFDNYDGNAMIATRDIEAGEELLCYYPLY